MGRRLWGGVLLCAVLLLVAVASGLAGREVPGTATAEPVRPIPQVGDCRLSAGDDSYRSAGGLPSPALVPCDGPRAGEVMLVVDGYDDAGPVSLIPSPCVTRMNPYLGLPEPADGPDTWTSSQWVAVDVVGPDARQRAAGQAWAACLVHPVSVNHDPPEFLGSARDVMRRPGPESAVLAMCADEVMGSSVSCRQPHRLEMFGYRTVARGTSDASLQTSCDEFAAGLTAMPDPTAGGALTAAVTTMPVDTNYPGVLPTAVCSIGTTDPARALTSTLRNLGAGTPPLS